MKAVFILFFVFACKNAYSASFSSQWWTNFCLLGVWRMNPYTTPICTKYYPSQMKLCDVTGNCWCARSRNSPPIPRGQTHPMSAVDCVKTINNCPKTMTYQFCSGCMLSCGDMHNLPSCHKDCYSGCNCPRNMFWNGDECVSAAQCMSDPVFSFSSNSNLRQPNIAPVAVDPAVQTTGNGNPTSVNSRNSNMGTSRKNSGAMMSRLLRSSSP